MSAATQTRPRSDFRQHLPVFASYEACGDSFRRSLLAQNRAPKTVKSYMEAFRLLGDYLVTQGMPTEVEHLTREHVESFIGHQVANWKPSTAANRYRSLQQFFRWCVDEGEITSSPMARMRPPKVPEEPPAVIRAEEMERLLKACAGREFRELRDAAMIWLLVDTGMRRSECSGLRVADMVVEKWEQGEWFPDYQGYPILFLYRQYLELRLKELIVVSAAFLSQEVTPPRIHKLLPLWTQVRPNLEELWGDEDALAQNDDIQERLTEFDALDPISDEFRYPVDKKSVPHFDETVYINLKRVKAVVGAIGLFLDGASAGIDYFREGKQQMLIESYEAERDEAEQEHYQETGY